MVAVTLLDPQLQFSAAEIAAGVEAGDVVGRADGSRITPYDLRRLQVRLLLCLLVVVNHSLRPHMQFR